MLSGILSDMDYAPNVMQFHGFSEIEAFVDTHVDISINNYDDWCALHADNVD